MAAAAAALACAPSQAYRAPALPACPARPVDTAGWQVIRAAEFRTVLPPTFRPNPRPGCIHGGEGWADGAREFSVCRGTGGQSARGSGDPGECSLAFLGRPAVVHRSWYNGRWWVNAGAVGDAVAFGVISASPDGGDDAVFLHALRAAQRSDR